MAALYLILALLIQNSLADTVFDDESDSIEFFDNFNTTQVNDTVTEESQAGPYDWMDPLIESSGAVISTSSAALITQAANSDKSDEEKVKDIKEIVSQISDSLQDEMVSLLSDAISCSGNDVTDNNRRKKRSIETPMDSSQLVMRLLRHIKSNNEYQNIAIEKMMSAQEIADKFGINFTPDPETLSDLALAANEQAKEMSSILKDAFDLKNSTQNVSNESETTNVTETQMDSTETSDESVEEPAIILENSSDHVLNFEIPEEKNVTDHPVASDYNLYDYCPVETQITSPPPQHCHAPVSQRPSFYDFVTDYPPLDYYCSMEPATTTIIISSDDSMEPEPELVAEEYEETISSKVFINHEEAPDVSTVNHVMSYTISEKAHYRSPHIESLPQQMQYYFFLM